MRKYLFILLLVLVLEGCGNMSGSNPTKNNFGLQILKIDGCEYAVYVDQSSGGTAMVHAGNCHNPIHHLYADGAEIKIGYGSLLVADSIRIKK
jgi:hypothetical protein